MPKKITFSLDSASIRAAISELEAYKQWIVEKTKELQKRVADELATEAQSGFASAIVDDILQGGSRMPDVSVSIRDDGDVTVVIASGTDAVWCEFGAGVYYNAPAGASPHPKGAELGLAIGSYGNGYGNRQVWGFYEGGNLKLTHGTPTQMPMYNAVKVISERISDIAKEVFSQ